MLSDVVGVTNVAALQIYTKLDCKQLSSNEEDTLQLHDSHVAFAKFSFNIYIFVLGINYISKVWHGTVTHSDKSFLPILVATLQLHEGLNHTIFVLTLYYSCDLYFQ